MIDRFLDWLAVVDGLLWGPWTMVFIAGVAVFFTVKSGFFQVRGVGHILRHTVLAIGRGGKGDSGSMSPFQAAATSLGGTVGMGNMAGVATALSVGGPGAIFWMWLLAFFGMMSKTVEITLGVHYRERGPDGQVRGGPMHTIRRGLGWTPLAYLFSAGMLINAMFSASLLQSHTVGRAFLASYGLSPYLVTAAMAVVTAMVVLGGVRRIGRFSGGLVPLMSLAYLTGAVVVIALNYQRIPGVLETIVTYAFTPAAGVGGATGVAVATAIKQGMARGMLSNEAGLGTAPMVHATAETAHPFEQGVWGAVEVFVDTIVIRIGHRAVAASLLPCAPGNGGRSHCLDLDPDVLALDPDRILRLLRDQPGEPGRCQGLSHVALAVFRSGRALRRRGGRRPPLGPGKHIGRRGRHPEPDQHAVPQRRLLHAHGGPAQRPPALLHRQGGRNGRRPDPLTPAVDSVSPRWCRGSNPEECPATTFLPVRTPRT